MLQEIRIPARLGVAIAIGAMSFAMLASEGTAQEQAFRPGFPSAGLTEIRVDDASADGVSARVYLRFEIINGNEIAREAVISLRGNGTAEASGMIGILEVRDSHGYPKSLRALELDVRQEEYRFDIARLQIERSDTARLRFEALYSRSLGAQMTDGSCILTMERACEMCRELANNFCGDAGVQEFNCGFTERCGGCSIRCAPRPV